MSYVGGVSNRLRQGQGTYVFPGGYYKYTGDWHLGKMHGHGIFFLGDGSTYEGTFVNGEIQGMGLRRWPDGTTYSGEFFRGEMHGEGTYIASSGKKYEGAWRDNQYHGYGELTDADQSLYEGHFDRHKPHGIGRKTWPDKSTYEGEWQDGKCHGHGRWAALDGTSYEGDWEDGNRHGVGKGVWPNGLIYDGTWTRNTRDKVPTSIVVTRLAPDGATPDPSPLVFRELPPANPADESAGAEGDAIPPTSPPVPPVKILPQFLLACCVDSDKAKAMLEQSNQTSSGTNEGGGEVDAPTITVVEESRHGIRMSLFQGKSPADVARDAAMAAAADADAKDKRKKSSMVEFLAPAGEPTSALLTTLIDPATQTTAVEWVVHTSHGVATIPRLHLPREAGPGDYFLQFDSTVDVTIPSAYFGFTIVRGDDPALDKAGSKKDVPKKK